MYIKTKSVEERNQFLKILFALGYKWHGDKDLSDVDLIEDRFSFSRYPCINVHNDTGYLNGNKTDPDHYYARDFVAVMEFVSKFSIKPEESIIISNVGDYEAEITKNGVNINVYTIPFDKIQEIADAVVKIKN